MNNEVLHTFLSFSFYMFLIEQAFNIFLVNKLKKRYIKTHDINIHNNNKIIEIIVVFFKKVELPWRAISKGCRVLLPVTISKHGLCLIVRVWSYGSAQDMLCSQQDYYGDATCTTSYSWGGSCYWESSHYLHMPPLYLLPSLLKDFKYLLINRKYQCNHL